MNQSEKGAKAKFICAQAYTHVLVQGQYAERQYNELIKNFSQDDNSLLITCQMTGMFLKKLQNELGILIQEIETVSAGLGGMSAALFNNIKTSSTDSIVSTQSQVCKEEPKPVTKSVLSLIKSEHEDKTQDDLLEIYRVETETENPPKTGDQTALLKTFEALSKIGNTSSDESMSIGSVSDSSRCSTPTEEPLTKKGDICKDESSDTSDYSHFSSQDFRDIYNVKQCYVVVAKVDDKSENSKLTGSCRDKEEEEIERLTNWKTLEAVRRQSQDDLLRPIKVSSAARDKKNHEDDKQQQSSSSESEADPEDSQFPITDFAVVDRSVLNKDAEDQMKLANAALATIGDETTDEKVETSDDTTDVDRDTKPKTKKLKKKREARKSSDEEKDENARWKDDPLLTGRLPTLSDDEGKKRRKSKSETSNSDGSTDFEVDSRPRKKRRRVVSSSDSSVSRIFVPDSESDDSSDLEIISYTKGQKHHRKNIRAVDDETLTEETRRAVKEEEARILRLKPKIEQMTQLSQYCLTEESEEFGLVLDIDKVTGERLVVVEKVLSKKLKEHQRMGVQFMWNNCYESLEMAKKSRGTGCILAHCMGLGKTLQVITLIHTLFKYPQTNTKHVAVVCPLSTVLNWDNEFKIAFKDLNDNVQVKIHLVKDKMTKSDRYRVVRRWRLQKGVLVVGYDAFVSLVKEQNVLDDDKDVKLARSALHDPGPDLIICDEGHLIKNDSKQRTRALTKIKTKRRIVLTGTPLQNNLTEYYQMVQFVKPNLLGTYKEFMNRFANPIKNGSYHDSLPEDIKLMRKRSHILHEYLKGTVQRYEVSELETYLPEKIDYVLFIPLHPIQITLYKNFLDNCGTEATRKRMLADYMALRNVWTHPYMLRLKEKEKRKKKKLKDSDIILPELVIPDPSNISRDWYKQFCPEDIDDKIEYGPKLIVAFRILEECEKLNEKLIIFSRSLLNLDAVEHFLQTQGTACGKKWKPKVDYLRMDGSVPPDVRMEYVAKFAENNQTRLFLISQEVGGMGINLVAANRIVLMDVSFNPAVDSQSIFRIYRFGQTRKCYIYRLVSMGTMEEVNYERSVTKSAISARVIDEKQISRHYKADDLQRMYRFQVYTEESRPVCKLPQDELLAAVMSKHKNEIFKYHEHQALLENRPEEQLNEEEQRLAWDEFKKEQEIAQQVGTSRQLVANSTTILISPTVPPNEQHRQSIATASGVLQVHNTETTATTTATTSTTQSNSGLPSLANALRVRPEYLENLRTALVNYTNTRGAPVSQILIHNNKNNDPSNIGAESPSDALIVLNDEEVIATMPHKEKVQPNPTENCVDLTHLESGDSPIASKVKPNGQDSRNNSQLSKDVTADVEAVVKAQVRVNVEKARKHLAKQNGKASSETKNDIIEIDLTEQ